VVASTEDEDVLSFIEVDNGTEHRGAIQRKAAIYRAHWQSGREQLEQGVFPLIVWLAKHERRRDQLSDWLQTPELPELHQVADPASLINLFTKGGTQ
jgi:hypothetical protein